MLLALLPKGAAWSCDSDSEWGRLFYGLAEEMARVDRRHDDLMREMVPGGAVELLDEWEADWGLPGPCIHTAQSLSDRRNALVSRYTQIGEQSRQMFIDVAARLGYAITITEYNEANPGPQTEYAGHDLDGDAWNYVWQINAPATTVQPRLYGSRYGNPYRQFGVELLECTLRALAHDHRVLFFSYA